MGDLPRASALLTPLYSRADDGGTIETQVYQAILERRTAPIIPRLKEMLSKPDSAPGNPEGELVFPEMLSKPDSAPGDDKANCAFGLAGHRTLRAIMPVRAKVGRKLRMNWNLPLKNNPKVISSLEISRSLK